MYVPLQIRMQHRKHFSYADENRTIQAKFNMAFYHLEKRVKENSKSGTN